MRTVIITGAAGAIGRALIEVLAEGPYRLGLIDVPGAPLADAAAITRVETAVHESLLDSQAACARAVAACGDALHGLVHLAGVYQPDPDLAKSDGVWQRAIEHNLANAYRMVTAVEEARVHRRLDPGDRRRLGKRRSRHVDQTQAIRPLGQHLDQRPADRAGRAGDDDGAHPLPPMLWRQA